MTVYIDRTGEPDDVFEREVLARVGDPVTAPQPATPGSDSVRAQIAAEMRQHFDAMRGYLDPDEISAYLAPLVASLLAEAKAEALEEAADEDSKPYGWGVRAVPVWVLRDRAAAYRTNPSSEETHRQHRMDADCWCQPVQADNGAWDHQ